MIPALHASRGELRDEHAANRPATQPARSARRLLSGLVVVEVALALVLLVGAGLMTRSFSKLLQVSPGFEPANLVAAQVLLPTTKYRERHRWCSSTRMSIERVSARPA